ncbi:MAG: tryptophan synthase subunit alpha [Chloroflexi bacterium]|nr:tryptophan synthase subunit alpha [Chloroflexota bacterium]
MGQAFRKGRPALIAYLTVGYPDLATTRRAVPALAAAGADLIELGIPFSDPLADGATIQEASFAALEGGITPAHCLGLAAELAPQVAVPLAFMSYYNPIASYGEEAFCAQAARSGVGGLIVPDLPPEEGESLEAACARHGLELVYFLAPTSTPERLALVAKRARGFIYLVSLTGVTGARAALPAGLEEFVGRVRRAAGPKPLAVGFGVASPEQARRVAAVADGVIVGSRLLQLIKEDPTLGKVTAFVGELRRALDGMAAGKGR